MVADIKKQKSFLVILTGISGAGKSIAIKSLEDLGFYCIDNLPISMISSALEFIEANEVGYYALGMDVRDEHFAKKFPALKKDIKKNLDVDVLYLTADGETIANRYRQTRRKHPLIDTGGALVTAVLREKKLLQSIEKVADGIFETTNWSPHFLARQIEGRYSSQTPSRNLNVTITSFGFKHGPYKQADSLFDVRFLDNPYFVKELREKTGMNKEIKDYVFKDERTHTFLEHMKSFYLFSLPNYYAEGKHYFRIGIGCTGGKHRSVCLAEALGEELAKANLPQVVISVAHRDVDEFSHLVQK